MSDPRLDWPRSDWRLGKTLGIGTVLAAVIAAGIATISWAGQIESRVSVLESRSNTISEWLNRVERKLDRVIEQR